VIRCTYSELIEEVRQRKKERKKERGLEETVTGTVGSVFQTCTSEMFCTFTGYDLGGGGGVVGGKKLPP